MTNQRPIETLRDGNIKAAIWENPGSNGTPYYAVSFSRTYRTEDGRLADTSGFTGSDLLKVAELARTAYTTTNELRRNYEPEPDDAGPIDDQDEAPSRSFNRRGRQTSRRSNQPA